MPVTCNSVGSVKRTQHSEEFTHLPFFLRLALKPWWAPEARRFEIALYG